jgi:hypothetical protein
MPADLLFSSDELSGLATAPGDRAARALTSGDRAQALQIARESINAHIPIREIYTTWNILTLAWIEREADADASAQCLSSSLRPILRPIAEWFRNGVTPEAVRMLAQMVRMDALSLAAVQEDDHTIVLVAPGWAGAMTAQLPGVPAMSTVTAAIERLCVEWLGYPPFVLDADNDTLRVTIHKDPVDVPTTVFARLGVDRDIERVGAAFSVSGARLFNSDERDAMCRQAFELAAAALERGDDVTARKYLALSKTEWYPMHHFMRDWMTSMLSWVHDNLGVRAVWDCVEAAYNRPIMGQTMAQVAQLELREQVTMLGTLFHQHGMKFDIVESAGGFEFRTAPCGSGGRLVDEGAYAEPKAFATLRGNGVETFGLDELPVYCMHCPATNRMVLEQGGPYVLLVEPDLQPDGTIRGHCSFHVFRSAQDVPAAMYERVGLSPSQHASPSLTHPG